MRDLSGRAAPIPLAAFAAAVIAAAVLYASWFGDLTFWRDEWAFLLHRRDFAVGSFLDPHYEHIVALPVGAYQALIGLFGIDSATPFQAVAVTSFLAGVTLLFAYLSRRVGSWLALFGCLPVLVLGAAWDDILWPFQIGFFLALLTGLGALLALDRDDRRGDVAACVLLSAGVLSSSLGLAFATGALVDVAIRRRLRRAYVAAVPLAIYALWWLGWGHSADTYLSLHNLATNPSYVLDGLASSAASLFGLASYPDEPIQEALRWGRPILVVIAVAAAIRARRKGSVSSRFWVVASIALAFWFLAGANASVFREPTSGRYQLMGVVFLLLMCAELFRGVRPGWRPLAVAGLVAAVATFANLRLLNRQYEFIRPFGELQPAGLAALEIARDGIPADFELTLENSGVDYLGELDAGSYLAAADAEGSPAYTEAELAEAPEAAREAADRVLAAGLGIELSPRPVEPPLRECERLAVASGASEVSELPAGGAVLVAPGETPVGVRVRRFAEDSFPVGLGEVAAGGAADLQVPRDRSSEPWELVANAPLLVCERSET